MTNEEKARERARQVFPCPNEDEQRRIVELAYNDACHWKDQQFKAFLEKKMAEYKSQRDDTNMWSEQWAVFHALTCTMHQIINELFKEN